MCSIGRSRVGLTDDGTSLGHVLRDPDENEEDGGAESDESDRKSKMSFSYWGADKITVQPTARGPTGGRVPLRRMPGAPGAYMRDARTESSANAKFGTRLRESSLGDEGGAGRTRPASRQTQNASRAGGTASVASTRKAERPAWGVMTPAGGAGGSGSSSVGPGTPSGRRGSATVVTPQHQRITKTVAASPAPSVDSGIAVYLAQDSTSRLDRV